MRGNIRMSGYDPAGCAMTRWQFTRDMNCDGLFTISDVGLWIHWLFFLPGDAVFYGLLSIPKLAVFLEITPAWYGGWTSGILSILGWLLVLIVLGAWGLLLERLDSRGA